MMYGMRRTTIYLPDELKLALERTAAAQGTSEAEVVRTRPDRSNRRVVRPDAAYPAV